MKITRFRLVVVIGIVAVSLFFASFAYYFAAVNRENFDGQGVADFVIAPGQRVYEIADNLRKARLINSASAFKLYVKLNNLDSKLQAGYYRIARDLSLKDLVDILQHGKFDTKLTFPEGWRREEMAYYASRQLGRASLYNEFLKESENLEGQLFPETYIVPHDITAKELVAVMKDTFSKKYAEVLRSAGAGTNLSKEEVVVLASVLEREAKKDEERPIIAGILIKRLQAGWPLEVDATIQYIVASKKLTLVSYEGLQNFEFWPKQITLDNLKTESPFNTRVRRGLPPAPICNPGVESLKAVLRPVETPYWFYLTGNDGNTRYASTLAEHTRNIEQFLRP